MGTVYLGASSQPALSPSDSEIQRFDFCGAPFSQFGNIYSLQSVDLPKSSVSAVESEWYRLSRSGKLLKVIVYGATSRHLSDSQLTTGTSALLPSSLLVVDKPTFVFVFAMHS